MGKIKLNFNKILIFLPINIRIYVLPVKQPFLSAESAVMKWETCCKTAVFKADIRKGVVLYKWQNRSGEAFGYRSEPSRMQVQTKLLEYP